MIHLNSQNKFMLIKGCFLSVSCPGVCWRHFNRPPHARSPGRSRWPLGSSPPRAGQARFCVLVFVLMFPLPGVLPPCPHMAPPSVIWISDEIPASCLLRVILSSSQSPCILSPHGISVTMLMFLCMWCLSSVTF